MGILDKLLEKKDILAYCDFRIKQIQINMDSLPLTCKPKSRERAYAKLSAMMKELRLMKAVVTRGVKKESIKISLEVNNYEKKSVQDSK